MKKAALASAVGLIIGFAGSLSFGASMGSATNGASPSRIIDRYRKASGAANRIESTLLTGTARIGDGPAGRFIYRAVSPDRIRLEVEAGAMKIVQCYNGKSAWQQDARGLRTLLGIEAESMRLMAILANGRLRELRWGRIIMRPASAPPPEGVKGEGLDFIMAGVRATIFFDARTGLPASEDIERAEGSEAFLFGDYRKVDGVMEPFSIRIKDSSQKDAPQDVRLAVEKVRHNLPVAGSEFRFPDNGDPLPNIDTLMTTLVANQDRVEQVREHYTFKAVETEHRQDDKGILKETETKTYEVIPVADRLIRKLVSINGKFLEGADKDKEDHRVQKEIEDTVKRQEKKKEKREKAEGEGKEPAEDKQDIMISTFLKSTEISSVRREVFHGQKVIAFDFEPRKDFKPHGLGETIASKFAGTIWVDPAALQIARLEAHLLSSLKLGGGLLASVSPSSYFVFEQEKVDRDVWLPSYTEANFAAKLMLLKKLKIDSTTRFSDYKKYHIDSDYSLKDPPAGANAQH